MSIECSVCSHTDERGYFCSACLEDRLRRQRRELEEAERAVDALRRRASAVVQDKQRQRRVAALKREVRATADGLRSAMRSLDASQLEVTKGALRARSLAEHLKKQVLRLSDQGRSDGGDAGDGRPGRGGGTDEELLAAMCDGLEDVLRGKLAEEAALASAAHTELLCASNPAGWGPLPGTASAAPHATAASIGSLPVAATRARQRPPWAADFIKYFEALPPPVAAVEVGNLARIVGTVAARAKCELPHSMRHAGRRSCIRARATGPDLDVDGDSEAGDGGRPGGVVLVADTAGAAAGEREDEWIPLAPEGGHLFRQACALLLANVRATLAAARIRVPPSPPSRSGEGGDITSRALGHLLGELVTVRLDPQLRRWELAAEIPPHWTAATALAARFGPDYPEREGAATDTHAESELGDDHWVLG